LIYRESYRSTFFLSDCKTWDEKMEGGYAVATLLLSILAAVIIFSIFPPNLINILLGIILGLLISVAIYAKEKYDEF
jgi:capsular polysaccharide biosynthesis protein